MEGHLRNLGSTGCGSAPVGEAAKPAIDIGALGFVDLAIALDHSSIRLSKFHRLVSMVLACHAGGNQVGRAADLHGSDASVAHVEALLRLMLDGSLPLTGASRID